MGRCGDPSVRISSLVLVRYLGCGRLRAEPHLRGAVEC